MRKIYFIITTIVGYFGNLFLLFAASGSEKNSKPNILFILADDCTYNEIGCYGGKNAKTPHIDHLASEGLLFNRAYVGMSMSVPCRHELYTGLYPMESGCTWNHARSKPGTKSVFHYLTDLGYRVGISGKKHAAPKNVFPYINVPGFEEICVKANEEIEDLTGIKRFMSQDNQEPFCLFVCSTSPHAPWTLGDASQYPPDQLVLPASLGDTPEVREAYSRYLAEVTYFDRQVGAILRTLEETGLADNTVVMLSTEQGWQFSGGKWTNWDIGVHTALIVKWPGVIEKGSATDALVQFADITPTLIDIANGKEKNNLSGWSFLDVLTGKSDEHREYVYCMHNNVPEGDPFPIRTVISKDYHYIHNLLPDSAYFEKHLEGGAHNEMWWKSWKNKAQRSERERFLVDRFYHRPNEELYSIKDDPDQFNNLANDLRYHEIREELRAELTRWMKDQGDPGIIVDSQSAFKNRYWDNKQ